MKKFALNPIFAVMTALAIPMLTACGGDDSDDNDNNTPTVQIETRQFIDSPVTNLPYRCLNSSGATSQEGVTDSSGNFKFVKGDTCYFMLNDDNLLGTVTLNTIPDYLSPYNLGDAVKAARIASLLQSLDTDGDPATQITLKSDDLDKLPAIELSSDDAAFEASMQAAATTPGLSQQYAYVAPAEAQDNMDESIAQKDEELEQTAGGYYSQNVDTVVQRIAAEEASNWQNTNFETELHDYEALLAQNDNSNGKDRELMQALLKLMEVTNDPIVASRITPENTANYTEMLPQVLDLILRSAKFEWNDPKGMTTDVADLMAKYAVEAASAADMIARSFNNPNRVAIYGANDEFTLNYDQAMAIRAAAMALASGLNIAASYSYGSDELILPKPYQGDLAGFTLDCTYEMGKETCVSNPTTYHFDNEYSDIDLDPLVAMQQANFIQLRSQKSTYLPLAKQQLLQAVELAQKVSCSDAAGNPSTECSYYINEDVKGMLAEVQLHLTKPEKQPTAVIYDDSKLDEEGATLPEGMTHYNSVEVNLHPFFEVGVDRSSFSIAKSGWCGYEYSKWDQEQNQQVDGRREFTATEMDQEFSQATSNKLCKLTESEVATVIAEGERYNLYKEFDAATNKEVYFPVTWYQDTSEMSMKSGSTADDVMVRCVDKGEEVECMPTVQ